MNWIKNISSLLFQDKDFARLQFPWVLYGLIILVVFILLFIWTRTKQKQSLKTFASQNLWKDLLPKLSDSRAVFRFTIWATGMFFLIFGASNLQFGDKKEEVSRAGIDLMICLDVSKSMMAEDLKPNRLKRAKLAISKIVNELGSDRIGIVVFAGGAYLQLPLTSDHSAAKMYLDNISTDIIPVHGTNIAAALETAVESFPEGSPTNKAIIVITDGEDHDGEAVQLSKDIQEQNIKVYTIGLGSTKGSTIPEFRNGKRIGVKKDKKGSTVITRLNQAALEEIAKAGGGKYIHGSSHSLGLQELLFEIGNIEKTEYESKEFTSYASKYQYFMAIGLTLILLELMIIKQKGKWFRKMV